MESKYKVRAEEILITSLEAQELTSDYINYLFKMYGTTFEAVNNAMCQLAEEVHKEDFIDFIRTIDLFSREQVEELLQKQRKLCANNARLGEKDEEFNEIICHYKLPYLLNNGNKLIIDKDSILNAKLKID